MSAGSFTVITENWSGTGREIADMEASRAGTPEPGVADFRYELGGGGGIRTHEGRETLTVFKTVAFVHSATPPQPS
jgi:hypothetical protein